MCARCSATSLFSKFFRVTSDAMSRTFQKVCTSPVERSEAMKSRLGVEKKTYSMLACKSCGPLLVGKKAGLS